METNQLLDHISYHNTKRERVLLKELKPSDKIVATRLRLTSDMGFQTYDISYFHATVNGKECEILLPTDHISRKAWKTELINMCKHQKIFIKDMVARHVISLNA